jgi:molybdopterin-containing oxidoreductase family membrane subunit
VQIGGLIVPLVLLLIKKMRNPLPAMIISIFVILGAWFKRYLIVIPTMEHPYLPIQHVPRNFMHYHPTLIEIAVTLASFILVLIIITVLSKLFPVIPIYDMVEEKNHEEN